MTYFIIWGVGISLWFLWFIFVVGKGCMEDLSPRLVLLVLLFWPVIFLLFIGTVFIYLAKAIIADEW